MTGTARKQHGVLEKLRHQSVTELGGVLSGFWSAIEEQVRLAALAAHDYAAVQEDRQAVLLLGKRALEFATDFRKSIETEFDRWENSREAEAPAEAVSARSLSLMSEDELDLHLAGRRIIELLDHQFLHPLAQLDERLAQLPRAGRGPNPLRPEVVVNAFVDLFKADDLTPGLREMVFQQFDRRLPKVLGEVYERANALLDKASYGVSPSRGAQPVIRRERDAASAVSPRAPVAGGNEGWVPEGGLVQPIEGRPAVIGDGAREAASSLRARAQAVAESLASGQPMRYRDLVREQLQAWRERTYGPVRTEAVESRVDVDVSSDDGRVLDVDELLSVAGLLQGEDSGPYVRSLIGEDARPLAEVIRQRIFSSVREIGFDPAETRLSGDEEDAIDLIGILFQSLFEANDPASPARGLYGRLVVPYLKVALTDDSLFNRRTHPARQLLDAITEACDGNPGETSQDREMLQHAERAVDRVVEEYMDDQAIFELASSELRDQLEQQRRRVELTERRVAESIHGRERLLHARRDADGLVASRMNERPLTAVVAHFLDHHWRRHLTQTWLRHGSDSAQHRAVIGLGDAMVQVDADAAAARGSVVAEQLLALQVPLGECYGSCGMDASAAREAMARLISALALPDTPRSVHIPQGHDEDDSAHDADEAVGLRLAGGTDTLSFDPAIAARMRRLRVGQGLRLLEDDGRETAARIAWVSPLTSRFLIVNRRGMRRMVASAEELAVLVASGRVVVRTVDGPFDEAMRQLWQRLNASQTEGVAEEKKRVS